MVSCVSVSGGFGSDMRRFFRFFELCGYFAGLVDEGGEGV